MANKLATALGCMVLAAGIPAFAQKSPTPPESTRPDNSRANKGDTGPTADQQSESKEDRALAKQIRDAITSDKSLSTYAHNVKVIVQNGVVTLKGPVNSESEKMAIESRAKSAAGKAQVENEITIAPSKTSK